MIYPSIDKLLNIVDSKYKLVHIISERSKQMHEFDHQRLKLLLNNLSSMIPPD